MKFKTSDFSNFSDVASKITRFTNLKKVKLTEHRAQYEDLIHEELFSDDELTTDLRKNRAHIENLKSHKNMKMLMKKVKHLKKTCVKGMSTVLQTIENIDQQSKQIVFKNLDENVINAPLTKSLKTTQSQLDIIQDTQADEDLSSEIIN